MGPRYVTNVNGALFFSADGAGAGHELWKSDGTEAGTVMVKDIYPSGSNSSEPQHLTNVNGTLFFQAGERQWPYDRINDELWKSDGTEAGTVMVEDIMPGPGSSSPEYLTNVNGTLFFAADDQTHGAELWMLGITLTAVSTDGGSVTTPGEGTFGYPSGDIVTLQATPDACRAFVNWTGTGVDAGKVADPDSAGTTITVDAHYTVVANFDVLDADEDDLPDCWEQQIVDDDPLDDIETVEDVLPGDDYDGDGMSNGNEYLVGTDPTDPNSVFKLTNIERTSGSFTITISWSCPLQHSYAVYYSDGPFGGSMTWTLAQDAIPGGFFGTTTWVDDGGMTGSAPHQVVERYYKVKVYGDGGEAFAKDIVGLYWKSVGIDRNLVSIPFIPFDTSLDSVIGDQLTGDAGNKYFSDAIEQWDPTASNYQRAWYDTSSWVDWDTGGAPEFDWEADVGYWINIMQFNDPKDVCFVGKVSDTGRTLEIAMDRNLCGTAYPVEVSLEDSELVESGFTGHSNKFWSDTNERWNRVTENYDRVYYDPTGAGEWKNWDRTAATKSFVPCEGFWVNVMLFNTPFTWIYPKPYTEPPN